MLNTKLFFVLKSMNEQELNRFQSFALSPYHNSNKTIGRFMKYISKYFHTIKKDGIPKKFNRELVFKGIYKSADFNEGTFAVLRSQTLSLLEDFFTIERFNEEKKLKQKFLAESYGKRKISKIYQNNYLKYERNNLAVGQKDAQWIVNRLEILVTKLMWEEYDKLGEGYSLLLDVLEDLDIFYLHQKMRNEALKASLSRGKRIAVEVLPLETTMQEQLTKYKKKSKVVELYVRLYDLLQKEEKNIIAVEKFRKEFKASSAILSYLDKDIIYTDLQNLVIKEYNQKGRKVADILFETYLIGIQEDLIYVNGKINYNTFYNIVVAGSVAKKRKELDNFIAEFGDKINESDRASTLILTEIRILHDRKLKKNWQKILKLTDSFNHSNIVFKCHAKSMRMRAFFRISQYDDSYYYTALSQIKGFKSFLAREKKGLTKVGQANQRLAFWLQKLMTAFNKKRLEKDILEIFIKIEKDMKLSVPYKEWLLELRDEMKNR